MARDSKDYGISDLVQLFLDMLHGNGNPFSNSVFAAPRSPSEYDAMAFEDRKFNEAAFRKFFSQITGKQTEARVKSLSATYGLGSVGPFAENLVSLFDKSAGQAMIGHHGGVEAVQTILQSANGMAAARGAELGGVLNPFQRARNLQYAATVGGAVYGRNFNADGSVNVDQTKGLTLNEAAYVSGRALSERGQYMVWANRIREGRKNGGVGLTDEEKTLKDEDIDNFVNGIKTTDAVARSFSAQIAKFNKGINGFVASTSKLTGDTMKAVELLQNLTGGQFFKAGKDAEEARRKAASVVNAARAAAIGAGMDPTQLLSGADKVSGAANAAAGFGDAEAFGSKRRFAQIGILGSMMFAKWQQANPKATEEEKNIAGNAVVSAVTGYAGSQANKMNLYAAKLMDQGVDLSGYEEALRSGNTRAAQEILIRKGGGVMNLTNFMTDEGAQARALQNNTETWKRLSATSLLSGRDEEALTFGQERLFNENLRDTFGKASGGNYQVQQELYRGAKAKERNAMLSEEGLTRAGVKNEQTRAMLRERLKNADVWQIERELGAGGYDANAAFSYGREQASSFTQEEIKKRTMTADEEQKALTIMNSREQGLNASSIEEARKEIYSRYGRDKTPAKIRELLAGSGLEDKTMTADEGAAALKSNGYTMAKVNPKITDADRKTALENVAKRIDMKALGDLREKAATGDRAAVKELEDRYAKSKEGANLTKDIIAELNDEFATGLSKVSGVLKEGEVTSKEGLKLSQADLDRAYKAYENARGKSENAGKTDRELQKEALASIYKQNFNPTVIDEALKTGGTLDKALDERYTGEMTKATSTISVTTPSKAALEEAKTKRQELSLEERRVAVDRVGGGSRLNAAASNTGLGAFIKEAESLLTPAAKSTATELDNLSKHINMTVEAMDALKAKAENQGIPTEEQKEEIRKVLTPKNAEPQVTEKAAKGVETQDYSIPAPQSVEKAAGSSLFPTRPLELGKQFTLTRAKPDAQSAGSTSSVGSSCLAPDQVDVLIKSVQRIVDILSSSGVTVNA